MEVVRQPRFKLGDAVDFYDDAQHKWSKGTVTHVQQPKNKYSPYSYDLDCARDVKEHLMEQWHSVQSASNTVTAGGHKIDNRMSLVYAPATEAWRSGNAGVQEMRVTQETGGYSLTPQETIIMGPTASMQQEIIGGSRGIQETVPTNLSGQSTVISGAGAVISVRPEGQQASTIRTQEIFTPFEPVAGGGVFAQSRDIEVSEPSRSLTVTERALESQELAAPQVMVCERVVEVPHIHEQDIVVEVPEIHHHKVTKHIPKYTEEIVDVPTEIPQVHVREAIEVKPEWQDEVVEKRVPVVTVREVENPVLKPITREEEEIVEVPVAIPSVERVIQRPRVELRTQVHHVKGETEIKRYDTEYVEVPHIVRVPRVVPVAKEEHSVTTKEVAVPHIRRVEKIVEVPEEKVIERTVEVPQVHVDRIIRHVPRFIQGDEALTKDIGEEDPYDVATDALRQANSYIQQLQSQKKDLSIQLEVRHNQILAAQNSLEEETRVRIQLEAQLEQAQNMPPREFAAPSPSTITTVGEFGEYSPATSTMMSSPGSRNISYEYKADTVLRPSTAFSYRDLQLQQSGAAPPTVTVVAAGAPAVSMAARRVSKE